MDITLKKNHWKRYKDIAYLLIKYGQADIVKDAGLANLPWDVAGEEKTSCESANAVIESKELELTADLEKLGPTFVKLGRLLSTRPDFLPLSYLEALSHLGENVAPMPLLQVQQQIEAEINLGFDYAFREFNEIPVSVSLTDQTHVAVLNDGRKVIVKVQRPFIAPEIMDDLDAIEELARFHDQHFRGRKKFDFYTVFEEFRRIIISELDYRQEAHNLRMLRENLKHLDHIVLPAVIDEYSSPKVLTMGFIDGRKISEIAYTGLLRSERNRLAEQVFYAYLQQFLLDGFVDADPDPHHVLLTNDGKLALLDMGTVLRIPPAMREKLIQLLLSVSEGRSEQTAELLLAMSRKHHDFDEGGFRTAVEDLVMAHREMAVEQVAVGNIFQGIAQAAVKNGVALPSEVAMLGTALLKLERVAHILNPMFQSNDFIHKNATAIMQQHLATAFSPAHLFKAMVEAVECIEQMPGKINRILDSVANNSLKVTIEAIDEDLLMSGFQKIANRITVGLVLAALIIGAALMMDVKTTFTIAGYPGIAILCFVAAAAFGFMLVIEVLVRDHKKNTRS